MSRKQVIVMICAVFVAFGGGFGLHAIMQGNTKDASVQDTSSKYPMLARRIFVEKPNDTLINFAPLRKQLQSYFDDNQLKGSLYFEYLPTGASARITADDEQVAASLMKLPAAMDAMKAIESGKISADHEITLQDGWLDSEFGELYKKGAGYKLTLQDAIKIMLVDSDNTALKAVGFTTMNAVGQNDSVLKVVDVDLTQNSDLTVSIGSRSYGSFLKCLYFACYINNENSSLLLSYLSETPFDNRLVAGIADDSIVVAHKVGMYQNIQSDCGIVYVPNRQYLLCVMLSGPDDDTTNGYIAALSKIAYEYVLKQ